MTTEAEREELKRHKGKGNDSFQDGKQIIQLHLDLHMTDVFLKNICKLKQTLNSPGTLGI